MHGLLVVVVSMLSKVRKAEGQGHYVSRLEVDNDVLNATVVGEMEACWQVFSAVHSHLVANTRQLTHYVTLHRCQQKRMLMACLVIK